MNRFFTVLAAVALAGAIYVAAAPGSRTAAGPTAKQFKALKAQVVKLKKDVTVLKRDTHTVADVIFSCMLHQTVGVAQRGDPGGTFGYTYTATGAPPLTTALDLSTSPTYTLLTLNPDPQLDCKSLVGLPAAKRLGGLVRFGHQH
jgi:hypothetical protein